MPVPINLGVAGNYLNTGNYTTTGTLTTVASAPTGTQIIVVIIHESSGGSVSVSDSVGNTYTSFGGVGVSGLSMQAFLVNSATALPTGDVITATFSGTGTNKYGIVAAAYGGTYGTVLDINGNTNFTFSSGGNPSISTTSPTLSHPVELIYGLAVTDSGGPISIPDPTWTQLVQGTTGGFESFTLSFCFKIVPTNSPVTFSAQGTGHYGVLPQQYIYVGMWSMETTIPVVSEGGYICVME